MHFQYLEIRPCVETPTETRSFLGEPQWNASIGDKVCTPQSAEEEAQAFSDAFGGEASEVFWTIYGRDEEGLAVAIGNFTTKEAAYEVMDAILAPMAAARDALDVGSALQASHSTLVHRMEKASATLEDFINQCSNGERL